MLLDKVSQGWDWGQGPEDEPKDLNSQCKSHINDLKASMSALETLIFCSHMAEMPENQTQNLTLQLAEL